MLHLLETPSDIKAAERDLIETLSNKFPDKTVKNIGFPGGTDFGVRINTDGRLWFYTRPLDDETSTPRQANWFGLFSTRKSMNITVEINVARSGTSARAAGFFARDDASGKAFLLHSGKVGGGQRGVGKTAFLAWSKLPLTPVALSNGMIRDGFVVTATRSEACSTSIDRYIDCIAQFKTEVREGLLKSPSFQRDLKEWTDYYRENSGPRSGLRNAEFDFISRHGDVVEALKIWREAKGIFKKDRIVKNVLFDLGVESEGKLTEIYEVKTSTLRADLYQTIGQLLCHSTIHTKHLFAVVPNGHISPDLLKTFSQLNIQLIRFDLTSKGVAF
ncbi:hypothetical protein [Xanthomonas phaseoli]|uniref:hypothetical protein n=2 Tax=Xanthomonas phaseoli TaxID=1985254 RepID=UPI001237B651|nr:hypothetical protein [Xanthomonas phaseoli]MBO9834407.1 hypothetical protein [Xanthomonas phaseoli pv. dieffenbachiae]MBO9838698.1 hypothetical protein [Xanthomonas phaseoli pv. dieffenbachiae]MBO9842637.1 hypothetical protein [Xanthomonas phaseoli pv. dieffenbachiae]MBO9863467.1 hypothetical protein [Xanthomonas phaseoli pv. dieffenbachiae]MBO9864373.1 hypothetical protein [Xanthomonas phaseoli pv. dieffenbachiae]